MLVIHVVFYVTAFTSRKIRCKGTTIFWNMQGLDEKKSRFVAIFLCLVLRFQIFELVHSLIH